MLGVLGVAATGCGSDGGGGGLPEAETPAGERGRDLVLRSGCVACHTADGSRGTGPTWQGLAGSTVALRDGRQLVADAAYLTRSITEPKVDIVDGYGPMLPEYPHFSAQDVADIVAYLQELPAD